MDKHDHKRQMKRYQRRLSKKWRDKRVITRPAVQIAPTVRLSVFDRLIAWFRRTVRKMRGRK